jgi:hypothetical protein
LGFKLKREWFRSIESLLGLRKGVEEFLTLWLSRVQGRSGAQRSVGSRASAAADC